MPDTPEDLARKRAVAMQASLDHTVDDERDTQALLARLDQMAAELFDLAQDWDRVDAKMAEHVRMQEKNVHELRSRAEHMAEMEADEASKINAEIRKALKEAIQRSAGTA
jgi:hypothetical protein